MPDEIDWELTTFEGNRRRQHQEFLALTFREKLARIEALGEVSERLGSKRAAEISAGKEAESSPSDHQDDRRRGG